MANRTLNMDQRLRLLDDLQSLKGGAADVDEAIIRTFLPLPSHSGALHPQTLVVRGERGAGKTAFFRFLEAMKDHPKELQELFPEARMPDSSWLEGFSEHGTKHPSTQVLAAFAKGAEGRLLRAFWMAHLACQLHSEGVIETPPPSAVWNVWESAVNEPGKWATAALEHVGPLATWTDQAEHRLATASKSVVVTYDYLDRIGHSGQDQAQMGGALMAVWQSLTLRYRHLRAKVFLREDLFESSQRAYPDASKLRSRSVLLQWDVDSLYRVLLRHMGAHESLRHWIGDKIQFDEESILGWIPPTGLPGRQSIGEVLMSRMVGPRMGKGEKKSIHSSLDSQSPPGRSPTNSATLTTGSNRKRRGASAQQSSGWVPPSIDAQRLEFCPKRNLTATRCGALGRASGRAAARTTEGFDSHA